MSPGRITSLVVGVALLLLVTILMFSAIDQTWWPRRASPPDPVAAAEPEDDPLAAGEMEDASVPPEPKLTLETGWDFFGGQPLEWWSRELNASRGGTEPAQLARFELLSRRALAIGLVLETADGTIAVRAPDALLTGFAARRKGERIGSIVASAREASGPGPETVLRLHPSAEYPHLILAPRDSPQAAAYFEFEAGTSSDGSSPGLTLLALHALLSANAHQPYEELVSELYASGTVLSFDVATDRSFLMLTGPTDRFYSLLSRLSNLLFRPRLESSRLKAARQRARHHNPSPDMVESLMHTLQMSSKSEPEPDRIDETLSNSDLETIARHARKVFCPANASIVVAGGFDATRVRSLLSGIRGGSRALPQTADMVRVSGAYTVPSRTNLELFAFPVALESEDAHASALLFASLLEDFIQARARRMGVAYTVSAMPMHSDWSDFVLLSVPLGDDAPSHTGEELERQLSLVASRAITDDSLRRNQQHVMFSLDGLQRNPAALSLALAGSIRSGSSFGASTRAALGKVSREDLSKLADQWLKKNSTIRVDLSPRFDRFERTEIR